MMLIRKSPPWTRVAVGGAVLASLLGGAYYASRTTVSGSAAPAVMAYSGLIEDAPPAAAPRSVSKADMHEPQRPSDIGEVEWRQLLHGVRNHPQRDQELQRMLGYVRFKRNLDLWTALKDQPNALERAQVGQQILDALPVRFANQEVTSAEALMLQSAIYADMIPDEAQRKPMEDAARSALLRSLEPDAAMAAKLQAEDSQAADFKVREASIMKRFKGQLIDQGQMEKELDSARVAAYQ